MLQVNNICIYNIIELRNLRNSFFKLFIQKSSKKIPIWFGNFNIKKNDNNSYNF